MAIATSTVSPVAALSRRLANLYLLGDEQKRLYGRQFAGRPLVEDRGA